MKKEINIVIKKSKHEVVTNMNFKCSNECYYNSYPVSIQTTINGCNLEESIKELITNLSNSGSEIIEVSITTINNNKSTFNTINSFMAEKIYSIQNSQP